MFVPLATLDRAVRLVEDLNGLTDTDDFLRVALPALAELIRCDLLTYNEVGIGGGRSVLVSDFVPMEPLDPLGLYNEFWRTIPVNHQLSVTLAVSGPMVVGIAFTRATREFDETDRAVLAVLRRPLLGALRRVRTASAGPLVLHGEGALTSTERVVLRLVAEGLTNQAIGHRLRVSQRTVAKHLEHTYRKMGVCNRAAAVSGARHTLDAGDR